MRGTDLAVGQREGVSAVKLGTMAVRKIETFPPVTMGHIRSHGCRDLLVYCGSGRCHHSATINADWLPDDMPVRSLCSRLVCTRCGMIGADVRPDWGPHVNKRRV
jgi:hypothetical protein